MTTYEKLVAEFGDNVEDACGHNQNKENIILNINDEYAEVRTLQKNGFHRINVYWKDGTEEELYE